MISGIFVNYKHINPKNIGFESNVDVFLYLSIHTYISILEKDNMNATLTIYMNAFLRRYALFSHRSINGFGVTERPESDVQSFAAIVSVRCIHDSHLNC